VFGVCVLRREFSLLSKLRVSSFTWFSALPRPDSRLPRLGLVKTALPTSLLNPLYRAVKS